MLRRGLVSVVLALVAGSASLSAAAVTARPVSYGIAATRICLTKHGAVFGAASDPAVAALPAAQRRKVLDGLLPPGTVHLFLVIGTTAADAESLRARIVATVEFKPTATNSRAGRLGNAAWFVVSLGSRPSLALMKTVSG